MTETEWDACTDPQPMLEFVWRKATKRKMRFFAAACCRRVRHLIGEEWKAGIELAEAFAEDTATRRQAYQAQRRLAYNYRTIRESDNGEISGAKQAVLAALRFDAFIAARDAHGYASFAASRCTERDEDLEAEKRWQADRLREFIGNPFRPITVNPSWLTATVTSLATSIYQERAFDRLPIVADALEDAGSNDEQVLAHLRSGGEHCRGCWALDLLLGKG